MDRLTALKKLRAIQGFDLRQLADKYEVTVWKRGKLNKGWAGHVLERYLGLPLNSSRAPNFGSWELKLVSYKYLKNGTLVPKETMAITMLDPVNVCQTRFEDSHLWLKLNKLVVCARLYFDRSEETSTLLKCNPFNLDDDQLVSAIRDDYELIRSTIIEKGYSALTGKLGNYIQPRTKGRGHGSVSRAFYARKKLVSIIVQI